MKRLIKSRTASWIIRCILFGPIVLWLGLFLWGWHTNYLDPGPNLEGKTLYEWARLLWRDHDSVEYETAVGTLSRHRDFIVPIAVEWTQRRDSLPREVFFTSMVIFLGRHFSLYEYGEEAHAYRGLGANVLGVVASDIPVARQILNRMAHDPNLYDYERDIARGHLGLPRAVDGWSPATLK
jgi:hypothetical protein